MNEKWRRKERRKMNRHAKGNICWNFLKTMMMIKMILNTTREVLYRDDGGKEKQKLKETNETGNEKWKK